MIGGFGRSCQGCREVEALRLIDEILRCEPIFGGLDEAALSSVATPQVRTLLRAKNGALALSGALAVFGCSGDPTAPMHVTRYKKWPARADYDLNPADDIFASDIFGDLLFARDGVAFRLDGETGEHARLGGIDDLLHQPLSEIAEELGGSLGREHFARRAIGMDPLRLLPTLPFMMQQHVRGEFFETPLSRAIELKHRLFVACRSAPEGARIDCGFWQA
jgi:hypothetical protein